MARVREVEEQIRDIGLLAVGRGPRFKPRLCPPSLGKRQGRRADNAQYDEATSVRMLSSNRLFETKAALCPGQVCDFHDHFRPDPMHF
jgi:hypothetical protein